MGWTGARYLVLWWLPGKISWPVQKGELYSNSASVSRQLVGCRYLVIAAIQVFRFSLLLLEFGEIYFEDFSAIYFSLGGSLGQGTVIER